MHALFLQAVDPFPNSSVALGGLLDHLPSIRRSRRMVFIACGTSYHAAMACRQTIEQLTGRPVRISCIMLSMCIPLHHVYNYPLQVKWHMDLMVQIIHRLSTICHGRFSCQFPQAYIKFDLPSFRRCIILYRGLSRDAMSCHLSDNKLPSNPGWI